MAIQPPPGSHHRTDFPRGFERTTTEQLFGRPLVSALPSRSESRGIAPRNARLDVLRALAILLVVGHHTSEDWLLGPFFNRIGWAGVDLFFVLSGYLVSGLLITEWQRRGSADVGRFLMRRAFKIYPSFWAMIAVTVISLHALGHSIQIKSLICELLFLQNYGPSLWASTWSLAIEEHFYLAVALLFVWFNHRGKLPTTTRAMQVTAALLVGVVLVRIGSQLVVPPNFKFLVTGTHVRGDALACGGLIALLRSQAPEALAAWWQRWRGFLLLGTTVLTGLVYVVATDFRVLGSVGYTMTYLSAAGWLLFVIHAPSRSHPVVDPAFRCLAFIGRASYGIYIWNLPVKYLLLPWLAKHNLIPAGSADSPALLFLGSIGAGISLSWLIEQPFLRLRDRWFPTRAEAGRAGFSAPQRDGAQSGAFVRA
jgi:peptidoglycan/LPS O-acetylase OafA/YrhL